MHACDLLIVTPAAHPLGDHLLDLPLGCIEPRQRCRYRTLASDCAIWLRLPTVPSTIGLDVTDWLVARNCAWLVPMIACVRSRYTEEGTHRRSPLNGVPLIYPVWLTLVDLFCA